MSKVNNPISEEIVKLNPQVANNLMTSGVKYIKYETVSVDLSTPMMVDVYVKSLFDECESVIEHQGGKLRFEKNQLGQYCSALLKMRVSRINRAQVPQWVRNKTSFVVPAFLSVLLSNIGIARDITLGIELIPTWKDDFWISEDDFSLVERELRAMAKFGFEYADAMPRGTDGSWDLMTMQVVNGEVVNHDGKAHGVFALLGCFLNNQALQTVLLPKVTYGATDRFGSLIKEFGRFK